MVAAFTVIFPLMPKGVEHTPYGTTLQLDLDVIFPLMPKGVEHPGITGMLAYPLL